MCVFISSMSLGSYYGSLQAVSTDKFGLSLHSLHSFEQACLSCIGMILSGMLRHFSYACSFATVDLIT